jgi:hypothetical protein
MKSKHLLIVIFTFAFSNLFSQTEILVLNTINPNNIVDTETETISCFPVKYLVFENLNLSNSKTIYFNKQQNPSHIAFNYNVNSNDSIAVKIIIYKTDSQLLNEQILTLSSTQGNVMRYELDLKESDYKGEVFIELTTNMLTQSNLNLEDAVFDVEFSKTLSMDIETFNLLDFYPNPSSGAFNILIKDGIQIKSVEVFEMNGRNLKDIDVNGTFVNLGGVHEGVFVVVVTTDVGPFTKKLVVRR